MTNEDMLNALIQVDKSSWRGTYDGVYMEVVRWKYPEATLSTWCGYFVVHEAQVPPTNWPRYWIEGKDPNEFGRVYYPIHETFFNDLCWPTGVSYYEKIVSEHTHGGKEGRCIKVGFSYGDDGWGPAVIDDALEDMKHVIRSLREVEPDLKYYCDSCGGFFHGTEGRSLDAEWYCDEHHYEVSMARRVEP